jgi:hypothetical protein
LIESITIGPAVVDNSLQKTDSSETDIFWSEWLTRTASDLVDFHWVLDDLHQALKAEVSLLSLLINNILVFCWNKDQMMYNRSVINSSE